jgi:hypothetical protein
VNLLPGLYGGLKRREPWALAFVAALILYPLAIVGLLLLWER